MLDQPPLSFLHTPSRSAVLTKVKKIHLCQTPKLEFLVTPKQKRIVYRMMSFFRLPPPFVSSSLFNHSDPSIRRRCPHPNIRKISAVVLLSSSESISSRDHCYARAIPVEAVFVPSDLRVSCASLGEVMESLMSYGGPKRGLRSHLRSILRPLAHKLLAVVGG